MGSSKGKYCLVLISLLLSFASYAKLKSGEPVYSGGKDGLAPMSFGLSYSSHPIGYAMRDGGCGPDIFVVVRSGLPSAKGLWKCSHIGLSPEGNTVYEKVSRLKTPWDNEKKLPGRIKVFQDGKSIYLLKLTKTRLNIYEYDEEDGFVWKKESLLHGLPPNVTSFDCIRRKNDLIEVVVLCNDGAKYRPETFKGDTQSYYDGAGMYRGSFPKGWVIRFSVNNCWEQVTNVSQVTESRSAIIAPAEIAAVRDKSGDRNGYVITNSQGCIKFVDSNSGNVEYLRGLDGNVLQHGTYGCRAIAYPSKDGGRANLLIGGECALFLYESHQKGYSLLSMLLEKDAALYGGSLTVPNVCDWDGDGADDIVAGNSEGRLLFFKNNGTNLQPDFALPIPVFADGKEIVLRPGYYVVQGPLEGAWGYLCPTVFDWNGDGLLDVVTSGSRARYEVFLNIGTPAEPKLDAPFTLMCDGLELHGSWRVRPALATIEGKPHIVIMDDENALHLYRQADLVHLEDMGKLYLADGREITGHNDAGEGLGQWGRGKLRFCDWDGDGDLDLFVGSVKRSSYPSPSDGLPYNRFKQKQYGMQVMLFTNVGSNDDIRLASPVQLQFRGEDFYLGAHSNAPEPCMLGDVSDGPNLIVGCESGKYFYFQHKDITYIR